MGEQQVIGEKEPTRSSFAEAMGRVFELGFNSGLLAAIQQRNTLIRHFGDYFRENLSHLLFPKIVAEMQKRTGVVSTWDKEALQNWTIFLLQRGYLAGANFFAEYLASFADFKPKLDREIVYLQCTFSNASSLETYPLDLEKIIPALMAQFKSLGYSVDLSSQEIKDYTDKGNFLNADTLMLLRYGRHWRILCADISIFALRSLDNASDLTSVERIRQLLETDLHYLRSKSVFTNLSIDTDAEATNTEILSGRLQQYFTAFKRKDKESAKFIQAASYAYSFYGFLLKQGILTEGDDVTFNVVGYTDRNINAMALKPDRLRLLETCAEIYKAKQLEQDIVKARYEVQDAIQRYAKKSFKGNADFIPNLVHLVDQKDGVEWLKHEEILDSFVNTRTPLALSQISQEIQDRLSVKDYTGQNILDVHKALIHQELANTTPYLFLTGHPGIGKTTAIVDFLKKLSQEGKGFLFLYVSPRKQVNLDIIQKFRTQTTLPPCEKIFGLTTSSIVIRNNQNNPAVEYYSDTYKETFPKRGVTFVPAADQQSRQARGSSRHLEEVQEGLLIDKGEQISGVLDSLCRGLATTIEEGFSNAIVATVAIQSLKRTANGQNTLRHLAKIFQNVYSTNNGKVTPIPAQMDKLTKHIQYFFVMIDEVSGDESGAEFLAGIHTFLREYQLLGTGSRIQTKIIVADASIVDPQIIQQHLANTNYEPDKIYFRRVPSATNLPLSVQEFGFKTKKNNAVVINANAYPARNLHLTYLVGVDAFQYQEETYQERRKALGNELQTCIIRDILAVIQKENAPQVLVYIQDKKRLKILIEAIRKACGGIFEPEQDYLEIHANISELDKQAIEATKDLVRVVFMTASASRGLSFKRAKHILIDIPHFSIEQNLMEILQVIYRGRGDETFDQQDKWLTFYLTDQVIYTDDENRELAVRERMLSLLNILLILKTSMMTRIQGSGLLGVKQHFMMIPIGGKSISAAGETFTSRISQLIKELESLSQRFWSDTSLSYVASSLRTILEHGRVRLIAKQRTGKETENELLRHSYLSILPHFASDFFNAVCKGFDHLLTLPPLELGYLAGGMLIVPITDKTMKEIYRTGLEEVLKLQGNKHDLFADMEHLSRNQRYPESLRVAMRDAIILVRGLEGMSPHTTSYYEQESQHTDQHYALPLVTFLSHRAMKEYFENAPAEKDLEDRSFRSLLISYIHNLYPADSFLPIGENYGAFPFVIFRSFNLAEARQRMFTEKYLFTSHEFNILNMLLTGK
jgi:hypothetical protein